MEYTAGNISDRSWKERTTSSTSFVIEYVNEAFEESEYHQSIQSVAVSKVGKEHASNTLEDFSALGSEDEKQKFFSRKPRKMYLAAIIVLLFAVCMGIACTYTATANKGIQLNPEIHPSDDDMTWISSLLPIGALTGGMAAGYFTGSFGRKGTLMLNTMPFVTGWLLIAYAYNLDMILGGRFLCGLSCGIISVATPMYLVEISTPEVRGLLGASFQLFVVIGVLLVSIMGSVLSWRLLAMSGATACLLSAFFMLSMPESPRWLLMKKRRGEAKNELLYLQGEEFDADVECNTIEEEIQKQPVGNIQFNEFKSPTIYKPFILSLLLMFFQQYSGINLILFYTVDIFKAAKVKNELLATIAVAVVQVLATFISTALIDKAGRRILLITSGGSMALFLFIFGAYDFANYENPAVAETYGWVPIFCVAAFIASFAIGFGPAPWMMVPEMTPARFRSLVGGISAASNWTFAFLVTKSYKALENSLHGFGMYIFYAMFCLLSVIFVYFFLPETKGKTAAEIESHFNQKFNFNWRNISWTRFCSKRKQ